jgi:hypothetical protein
MYGSGLPLYFREWCAVAYYATKLLETHYKLRLLIYSLRVKCKGFPGATGKVEIISQDLEQPTKESIIQLLIIHT